MHRRRWIPASAGMTSKKTQPMRNTSPVRTMLRLFAATQAALPLTLVPFGLPALVQR
jgi:hypothetical protein